MARARKSLTQTEAAERLQISTSWLRVLTDRGLITRNSDGTYPWPKVKEEYRDYQASSRQPEAGGQSAPTISLDEARARKTTADAALKELDLASRRGELVPIEAVVDLVRAPLEAVDTQLRTAKRTHSKAWAAKLGITQAEAMALIHDLVEDIRANLMRAIEDVADHAP